MGYNDRQQVFIVRNSWGESWADRGYAYVPYDYIANPEFNFLGMYTITGLTETDFTPDADDGQDFSYDSRGDGNAADITDYEEPVPPSNKDLGSPVVPFFFFFWGFKAPYKVRNQPRKGALI